MNTQKQIDLQFGEDNEKRLLSTIQQFFNDDSIIKIACKYSAFDFIGDNILIELKTRRCSSFTYPTTIIGINKFKYTEPGIKYILIFSFTDLVLYIEYDEEIFKTFSIKTITRRDRGQIEKALYYHIPIKLLKPIIIDDTL
jgi:hypothetical protein